MLADLSKLSFPQIKTDVLTVYNDDDVVLRACEPAFINDFLDVGSLNLPCFKVCGDVDKYGLWGVIASDIAPGSLGFMQIHGLCRAFIQNGDIGDWVTASCTAGISTCFDGTAQIVSPGTAAEPGLLMLGLHSGNSYDGEFKVSRGTEENTLKISGGYTDLNGGKLIEDTIIPYAYGDEYVYFCGNYLESYFQIYFTADASEAAETAYEFRVQLASLHYDTNGALRSIKQLWRGTFGICFGGRYILE